METREGRGRWRELEVTVSLSGGRGVGEGGGVEKRNPHLRAAHMISCAASSGDYVYKT